MNVPRRRHGKREPHGERDEVGEREGPEVNAHARAIGEVKVSRVNEDEIAKNEIGDCKQQIERRVSKVLEPLSRCLVGTKPEERKFECANFATCHAVLPEKQVSAQPDEVITIQKQ